MPPHEILEGVMMLCFGASWPMQIIKTIRVKNPTGKSFLFLFLLMIGYLAGMAGKLFAEEIPNVIWFYLLNFLMVSTDMGFSLYYKWKLDRKNAEL